MMRFFSGLLVAFLLISCGNETKQQDFVSLKGTVKTDGMSSFKVASMGYSKTIAVDENGAFNDTLHANDGYFGLLNGQNDGLNVFLKKGYNLEITFNGEKFTEGASFLGEGSETNNYLEAKRAYFSSDEGDPETYFNLDRAEFDSKIAETKTSFQAMEDGKNVDSLVLVMDGRNSDMYFKYLESNYEAMHELAMKFSKGTPSPKFVNYENFEGGSNSLEDYKGKYVYLDIWATWCGPCKAEIPYLKNLEEEFKEGNITFISISVDKPQAYDAWRKMVKEESLSGVQLYADNNFESEFIMEYGINAIPRFILLDPEGNIVNANAIRPSNPEISDYFKELGI